MQRVLLNRVILKEGWTHGPRAATEDTDWKGGFASFGRDAAKASSTVGSAIKSGVKSAASATWDFLKHFGEEGTAVDRVAKLPGVMLGGVVQGIKGGYDFYKANKDDIHATAGEGYRWLRKKLGYAKKPETTMEYLGRNKKALAAGVVAGGVTAYGAKKLKDWWQGQRNPSMPQTQFMASPYNPVPQLPPPQDPSIAQSSYSGFVGPSQHTGFPQSTPYEFSHGEAHQPNIFPQQSRNYWAQESFREGSEELSSNPSQVIKVAGGGRGVMQLLGRTITKEGAKGAQARLKRLKKIAQASGYTKKS